VTWITGRRDIGHERKGISAVLEREMGSLPKQVFQDSSASC
jgi:hypothetical protein